MKLATPTSVAELAFTVPLRLPVSTVKPLPYIGAKTKDVWNLTQFLPKRIDAFFEPFCGSAAFSFHLLKEGLLEGRKCFLSDSNPELMNFYHVLQGQAESLTLRLLELERKHGIGYRQLYEWAIEIMKVDGTDGVERAAAYYAAKHLSYGGKEQFTPGDFCDPSKSNKRVKAKSVLLLPLFAKLLEGSTVRQCDYKEALAKAASKGRHALAFLDPPYTGIADTGYYAQNDACLNELAEECRAVANKCKFMVTLNDSPENRTRFKGFKIITRNAYYGTTRRKAPELLVLNFEPPLYACALAQTGWEPLPQPANDNAVALPKGTPPLPSERYQVILADPPWPYYGSTTKPGAAAKHYALMNLEEIKSLNVRSISEKKAVCFLWCTSPMMQYASEVFDAWGFEYNNISWVWAKTRKDGQLYGAAGPMPSYTKTKNLEYLLVGSTEKYGKAPWTGISQRGAGMLQLVRATPGAHSEKPAVFRDLIVELVGNRPRIELFARQRVPGWDAWGNEAE